jgi:MFS transporter, ACS family, aldohexuronate transporter
MNSSNSPQTSETALPATENAATVGAQTSSFRWVICALLFLATVIAYVDRGVIGYLEKYLETVIGWNTIQYGYITGAFQLAYAIGLVCAGRLTDRLGTRKGFAIAISIWSIAAMLPGAAYSVITFGLAMFILGLGEAANFPACIKTVAEWFPRKERALATGIFNSGANIGNIVVPLVVPFLVFSLGWRGAFIGTGALGFVWLALWLSLYAKPEMHPRVSANELALIQSDPRETVQSVPWVKLLPRKETWAFSIAKFLTDPIWWFYLFWLPRYLQGTFHLNLAQSRKPVVAVYVVSIVGSIGGGWISANFLKRGRSPNFARKMALLICALAVVPVVWAPFSNNLWVVVGLVGVAAAAHQGWSANLFTLPSDTFPKAAIASVVGIGGMMGAIGGALLQTTTGYVVARANSYVPLFVLACSVYLVALLIVQLLAPNLAPAKID